MEVTYQLTFSHAIFRYITPSISMIDMIIYNYNTIETHVTFSCYLIYVINTWTPNMTRAFNFGKLYLITLHYFL